MRLNHRTTVLTVLGLLFTLTMAVPSWATEKEEQDFWAEDAPRWGRGRFELTEERIGRIMKWLEESELDKAQELKQLREKDADKFKEELRKVVHERIHRGMRERMEQRTSKGPFVPGMRPGPEGLHRRPSREMMEERLRESHEEYIEWLKKNYPEKSKELAELKEQNQELYMKNMMLGMKKYRRILWAAKDNPELAEVLKKDMELKQERDELIRKIRTATNDEEKKELRTQLEKVVSNRFDLIVKRKQIEYERLLERLEKLKQEVKEREAEVEKWKEAGFKSENVKNRIEKLIGRTEEINWD